MIFLSLNPVIISVKMNSEGMEYVKYLINISSRLSLQLLNDASDTLYFIRSCPDMFDDIVNTQCYFTSIRLALLVNRYYGKGITPTDMYSDMKRLFNELKFNKHDQIFTINCFANGMGHSFSIIRFMGTLFHVDSNFCDYNVSMQTSNIRDEKIYIKNYVSSGRKLSWSMCDINKERVEEMIDYYSKMTTFKLQ